MKQIFSAYEPMCIARPHWRTAYAIAANNKGITVNIARPTSNIDIDCLTLVSRTVMKNNNPDRDSGSHDKNQKRRTWVHLRNKSAIRP